MKPSSFCTLCTKPCSQELAGCLLTLSIHHRDEPIFIICDTAVKDYIDRLTPTPRLNMHWIIELDEFSNLTRTEMVKLNIWSKFQMYKARAIECALEKYPDVLYIDSDTIILDSLDDIDTTKQLGVSPQFIRKKNVDETGYYNGGLLWTNMKSLPDRWRFHTEHSRYFDQASIEDLAKEYSYFEFGENYNLQAWRFLLGLEPTNTIASYITAKLGRVMYKDAPLKFIHTHFNDGRFKEVNSFLIKRLTEAKCYKELACIYRVMNNAWILRIPKQPMGGLWRHADDSYRELARFAGLRRGDMSVKDITTSGHCWIEPNVLIYDRPTLEWYNSECVSAGLVLFGNGSASEEGVKLKARGVNYKPWIFWPRNPVKLEVFLFKNPRASFMAREIDSIFIGNFENSVQEKYRIHSECKWEDVLSEYHCTAGKEHKFTQDQYLSKLHTARYGLCLRGYGSKCHREVELMALGTVPLITPEVSISSYLDPPIENTHFIRVNSPDELVSKISKISADEWELMSVACVKWYMKNIHTSNFWNNTISYVLYDT